MEHRAFPHPNSIAQRGLPREARQLREWAEVLTRLLEWNGGVVRVEQLLAVPRCSRDIVLLALGWLARNGFVTVEPGIGDWVVKMRDASQECAGGPA